MKHARSDYNRIQDPAGLIPEDEPVFLLRGKDICAPEAVRHWALSARRKGASMDIIDAAFTQADAMEHWQIAHGSKTPDMPEGAGAPSHDQH